MNISQLDLGSVLINSRVNSLITINSLASLQPPSSTDPTEDFFSSIVKWIADQFEEFGWVIMIVVIVLLAMFGLHNAMKNRRGRGGRR